MDRIAVHNFNYGKKMNSIVEHIEQNNLNYHRTKLDFEKKNLLDKGLILSKLEIDEKLPNTPIEEAYISNSEIPVASQAILRFLQEIDVFPVVYEGENDGKLIRHVVPKSSNSDVISSHGSLLTFFPHVDNPDLKLRYEVNHWISTPCPDTLSLFCLRNQPDVYTSLIKLEDVLSDLSDKTINILKAPNFGVYRPASFGKDQIVTNQLPLLVENDSGDLISRFDYHNVKSSDEDSSHALEEFKKSVLDRNKWVHYDLKPKECITFDNQKYLHSRNNFTPLGNGNDRWLLRVFGLYQKPLLNMSVNSDIHHLKTFNSVG